MRAVSNSLLAVLLLGALLWGNCFSCPQLLLSLAAHAPSHGCCKHSDKQPATSQDKCQSYALKHFVKADPTPELQLPASVSMPFTVAGTQPVLPAAPKVVVGIIPHSPPDLAVLNSTFRI
jgi:hypothetical protein